MMRPNSSLRCSSGKFVVMARRVRRVETAEGCATGGAEKLQRQAEEGRVLLIDA